MNETAQMPTDFRSLIRRLGIVGRLAALLALLAAIVFVLSLRGLGRALFVPSAREAKRMADDQMTKLVADYSASMDGHVKQFDGRSVFFVPSPPVPPPPAAPPKTEEDNKPPPPPTKPASYGGPKLIGMVNGVAWFDDGKRLSAGSEAKDDLKVKEIQAPWGAVVEWKGVEFKISLLEHDSVIWSKAKDAPKDAAAKDIKELAKETSASDVKPNDKPGAPPETKPEPSPETKPNEPKPVPPPSTEPKPDQPKPEEPKPGEPKPAEPKQE
jgi:hypothetical protein